MHRSQRIRRLLDKLPLPLARDQAPFAGAEIILRECDQGADQFGDAERRGAPKS